MAEKIRVDLGVMKAPYARRAYEPDTRAAQDSLQFDIEVLDLEILHHKGFSFIVDIFQAKKAELVGKLNALAGQTIMATDEPPDW